MKSVRVLLVACVVIAGLWVFGNLANALHNGGALDAPTVDGFANHSQVTRQ